MIHVVFKNKLANECTEHYANLRFIVVITIIMLNLFNITLKLNANVEVKGREHMLFLFSLGGVDERDG